jgi:hypothetical protein
MLISWKQVSLLVALIAVGGCSSVLGYESSYTEATPATDASIDSTDSQASIDGGSDSGLGGNDSSDALDSQQDSSVDAASDSSVDSGAADSSVSDSNVADSGPVDSSVADSGATDSGTVDSGTADSGAKDSGVADSWVKDSGADTGTTCADWMQGGTGCDTCLKTNCTMECHSCPTGSNCAKFYQCALVCPPKDGGQDCFMGCASQYSMGVSAAEDLMSCIEDLCLMNCPLPNGAP